MPGSSPSARREVSTSDQRFSTSVGLRRPGTDQTAELHQPDACEQSQRGVPSGLYVWWSGALSLSFVLLVLRQVRMGRHVAGV